MTDQTIPADKVREILDEWERIKEYADWEDMDNLVQDVRALLPTPPLPTLADMSPVARRECQWMQCEVRGDRRAIILIRDDRDHNHAVTLDPYGHTAHCPFERVTPRPDLPRMEWPGAENAAPAPTLPDGWRLADHEDYGRGIVTNTTPDADGDVYFAFPFDDPTGYDWDACHPDRLTYIDQEAADATD